MSLDEARLNRLSTLARLDVSARDDASRARLRKRLESLLAWTESTHHHGVMDVEPLLHPADLQTWMRADEAVTPPGAAAVLRNAPASDQDSFLVPQVVDDNA